MASSRIDPAPRKYVQAVSLLRRIEGDTSAAAEKTTVDAIVAWLLADAMREDDLLKLFEKLARQIVAAGLPLARATLHVGTLHPQMIGFAWHWERADGLCDEVRVDAAALTSDAYRRNPMYRVIEHGEVIHAKADDPEVAARFPIVADLAKQGITEYIAMPIGGGGAYHNAATIATKQPGGFSEGEIESLDRILHLLALHVERHIVLRIAGNVLDTYLGAAAGRRVLRGSIKRGSGEPIHAVIWVSDLRDYTDLADRLDGADMIGLLNAYFERLVGAVIDHGGEVLKFVGDGLLAAFPLSAFADAGVAASASLDAAEQALAAIKALNANPPEELAGIDGWRPLRTGIALHEGEVFFGNVGAPERLDFTVIGRAVNAASRVEALTKELHRPILITAPVAALLDRPLDDMGEHALRGVAEPVRIFSPCMPA